MQYEYFGAPSFSSALENNSVVRTHWSRFYSVLHAGYLRGYVTTAGKMPSRGRSTPTGRASVFLSGGRGRTAGDQFEYGAPGKPIWLSYAPARAAAGDCSSQCRVINMPMVQRRKIPPPRSAVISRGLLFVRFLSKLALTHVSLNPRDKWQASSSRQLRHLSMTALHRHVRDKKRPKYVVYPACVSLR